MKVTVKSVHEDVSDAKPPDPNERTNFLADPDLADSYAEAPD